MLDGDVRKHKLFPYYHRLDVLSYAGFALLILFLCADLNLLLTIGIGGLVWGVFECAYSLVKYQSLLPPRENMFGTGWYITGKLKTLTLNVFRLLISILCIVIS